MSMKWLARIRKTGKLTAFNLAASWGTVFEKARKSFNTLKLGVEIVLADDEKSANIVVVLADGPKQYPYFGQILKTKSTFKADGLHGQTSSVSDDIAKENFFAAIFVPGLLKNTTMDQKEMLLVHEFIHAAGMNEHDSEGIMFATMAKEGSGLIEYLHEKDTKSMPAIRVGGQTKCIMQSLWSDVEECRK